MRAGPDHNSTPLSMDRFELERRMKMLMLRPDYEAREWRVLEEVLGIIGRMAEEADAGISTFYDHGDGNEIGK